MKNVLTIYFLARNYVAHITSLKFWSVIDPNAVVGSICSRPHAVG